MAEYYYATLTYSSGEKVRVVHKGQVVHPAMKRWFAKSGMALEVEERLPPDKEREYELVSHQIASIKGLDWHPQMDVPEDDDD